MNRNQFAFYDSYWQQAKLLKKKSDRVAFIDAVCEYSLYGREPSNSLPKRVLLCFEAIRGEMDKEVRQSLEGRRCAEYKAWRKAVYERDDYTCQTCGKRGVDLNAHHKKPYAWYPDLRYSVSNGITLCVPCHKLLHRRRRNGN